MIFKIRRLSPPEAIAKSIRQIKLARVSFSIEPNRRARNHWIASRCIRKERMRQINLGRWLRKSNGNFWTRKVNGTYRIDAANIEFVLSFWVDPMPLLQCVKKNEKHENTDEHVDNNFDCVEQSRVRLRCNEGRKTTKLSREKTNKDEQNEPKNRGQEMPANFERNLNESVALHSFRWARNNRILMPSNFVELI